MKAIVCAACRQSVRKFNIVRGMCSTCYARDLRVRKRVKTITWEVCSKIFQSIRRDAEFCSSPCRQLARSPPSSLLRT